jgi:hypothetical protein
MENSENEVNRRMHERVVQKGYIKVVVVACPDAPPLEGEIFQCTTRDLSSGGLKMVVHSPVPVGSMIRVYVTFNDPNAEFENIARVAWSQEIATGILLQYGLGLEFTNTKSSSGHVWESMVRSRMRGSGGVDSQADVI